MPSPRPRPPLRYAGFRLDLGAVLRARRKALRIKQATLADAICVQRSSLSAIENGHAWPLPDTLEGLMSELDLDWSMVLKKGAPKPPDQEVGGTDDADRRLDLGRALRSGRLQEGSSLWQVAERCGLSAAQLSRLERGQATRSRVYAKDLQGGWPVGFKDPELQRLYLLGDEAVLAPSV